MSKCVACWTITLEIGKFIHSKMFVNRNRSDLEEILRLDHACLGSEQHMERKEIVRGGLQMWRIKMDQFLKKHLLSTTEGS